MLVQLMISGCVTLTMLECDFTFETARSSTNPSHMLTFAGGIVECAHRATLQMLHDSCSLVYDGHIRRNNISYHYQGKIITGHEDDEDPLHPLDLGQLSCSLHSHDALRSMVTMRQTTGIAS